MKRLFSKSLGHSTGLEVAALAPMVDLFTLLVIAVLRSSSPEAPLQLPEEQLLLPISTLERSPASGIPSMSGKKASMWMDGEQARHLFGPIRQIAHSRSVRKPSAIYPSGHIKIRPTQKASGSLSTRSC